MRHTHVFDVIKQLLRERAMTYAMLADALGMSESGVKKIFVAADCSLSRLAEIAAVLEVSVEDIVREAEEPAVRRQRLDFATQQWFLDHPRAFAVFWKSTVERLPPARIAADLEITPAEVDDEMRALSGLQPPELTGSTPVRWLEVGPLLDHLNRTWTARLLEDALAEPDREGWLFRLHQLPIRDETLAEVHAELEAVCDAAVRRARREAAIVPADARRSARLLVVSRPGSFT